jgi:hypothetical protein
MAFDPRLAWVCSFREWCSRLLWRGSTTPAAKADPELALTDPPMDTRSAHSLVDQRTLAWLAGDFLAIAMLLTGVGTYGVLSYAAAWLLATGTVVGVLRA